MTKVLDEKEYTIIINNTAYFVCHQLIWDKHYPATPYWETHINGELKRNRYSWLKRYTMPSKSEIKKYIEKYY